MCENYRVFGRENGDLSLLTIVRQTFRAWFFGVIAGAGALTALVVAAIMVLTAKSGFANGMAELGRYLIRNLFKPGRNSMVRIAFSG